MSVRSMDLGAPAAVSGIERTSYVPSMDRVAVPAVEIHPMHVGPSLNAQFRTADPNAVMDR
jgi:hypothetical protein